MHIKDFKIANQWLPLTDILDGNVDAEATYTIMNSSPDQLYAVEADGAPAEEVIGVILVPNDYLIYKKGEQELFIRNGATPVIKNGINHVKESNITINKVG